MNRIKIINKMANECKEILNVESKYDLENEDLEKVRLRLQVITDLIEPDEEEKMFIEMLKQMSGINKEPKEEE